MKYISQFLFGIISMIIPFAKFEINNKYKIFKSFSIIIIPKLILYFQRN